MCVTTVTHRFWNSHDGGSAGRSIPRPTIRCKRAKCVLRSRCHKAIMLFPSPLCASGKHSDCNVMSSSQLWQAGVPHARTSERKKFEPWCPKPAQRSMNGSHSFARRDRDAYHQRDALCKPMSMSEHTIHRQQNRPELISHGRKLLPCGYFCCCCCCLEIRIRARTEPNRTSPVWRKVFPLFHRLVSRAPKGLFIFKHDLVTSVLHCAGWVEWNWWKGR